MLTDASIEGKVDRLLGLKENVIIGKLIPAATGLKRYRTIEIGPTEPVAHAAVRAGRAARGAAGDRPGRRRARLRRARPDVRRRAGRRTRRATTPARPRRSPRSTRRSTTERRGAGRRPGRERGRGNPASLHPGSGRSRRAPCRRPWRGRARRRRARTGRWRRRPASSSATPAETRSGAGVLDGLSAIARTMRPAEELGVRAADSGRITANSSPPKRHGKSVVRTIERMRRPTSVSTASPARWPAVSLIA